MWTPVFCSLRSSSKRKDDDYKPLVDSDEDDDDDQHSNDSYSVGKKKTRTPKSVTRRPSARTPTSSKKPKVEFVMACFRILQQLGVKLIEQRQNNENSDVFVVGRLSTCLFIV